MGSSCLMVTERLQLLTVARLCGFHHILVYVEGTKSLPNSAPWWTADFLKSTPKLSVWGKFISCRLLTKTIQNKWTTQRKTYTHKQTWRGWGAALQQSAKKWKGERGKEKGKRQKGNPPEEKGEKWNSVFWNFCPMNSHRFHPVRYTETANPLGLVRQQRKDSSTPWKEARQASLKRCLLERGRPSGDCPFCLLPSSSLGMKKLDKGPALW